MRLNLLLLATAALVAHPVLAGEEVLYEAAPEWVEIRDVATEGRQDDALLLLFDHQSRIERGRLWTYEHKAVALDSPQALTQFGTLTARWLPDKGDLRVHFARLRRDGEVIDLLDGEYRFEVIRREERLESRLIDGALTATMNVPGARIGDVIELAISTTLTDQAMGDNVQWQIGLPADPFPLKDGRVRISWPEDLQVTRLHKGKAALDTPALEDGYFVWSVGLPIDEIEEMPDDAPFRFNSGEHLQVTTYADWQDVSANMAEHYDPSGTVEAGSELAEEIFRIAAASQDPLTRAAMALQLVQNDVSYLMNGLDGGNYLPQSPEETWAKRFGDCKAKSLLLLAMLRELGVSSDVVLVRTNGGDALPEVAPMPANFDHMIVRAEIGGTNYWLDGTSAGTTLETIDEVPRFHYALPLRIEGTGLVELEERPQSTPDRIVQIKADQSHGVRLPAIYDVEVEFRGASAAQLRLIAELGDESIREQAAYEAISDIIGDAMMIGESIDFDPETGVARVMARAIQTTPWQRDDIEYELVAPAQAARDVGFEADRARAAWRDIPLRLNGPIYYASEFELLLPDQSGQSFEMIGNEEMRETIGGVEIASRASLYDNRFTLSQTMRSVLEELPADQLPAARRALARFIRGLPVVQSVGGVRELWEYFGKDRALLDPLEAFYAEAIAEADTDDPYALLNRARFRAGVYDHSGALDDVDSALKIEASRPLYLLRASLRRELGDLEGALADLQTAEDLDPDGSTYETQVELLALLGRTDEAIAIAEDYASFADDPVAEANLMATALGWAGSVDEALTLLEALVRRRPGDGSLLNAVCWNAAIWDAMSDERLATCVEAVEKSDYSAAALDSRALAHLRVGNLDQARMDVDAALLASPGLGESRLLRGIIKVKQGDTRNGLAEIELALAMRPSLEKTYKAWGLDF